MVGVGGREGRPGRERKASEVRGGPEIRLNQDQGPCPDNCILPSAGKWNMLLPMSAQLLVLSFIV